MTYSPGFIVSPSDYLTLIGGQASDVPFPSEAAAANKLAGIVGVGYGQYGYMQTTSWLLRPVSARSIVSASDWARLQAALEGTLLHQGQSTANAPPADMFDRGDIVNVHNGRPGLGDWLSHIPTIDNPANRLADPRTNPGSYTLVGPVITNTKTQPWGVSTGVPGANTLSFGVEFTWASGDHARAFFNAGGEIVYRYSYGNTSTGHAAAWTDFLENTLSDIRYGRDYVVFDGTLVPVFSNSRGYWNATGTEIRFIDMSNLGSPPPYTPIRFRASHERRSAADVSGNGDNGNKLFLITVPMDQYSGPDDEMPPGVVVEVYFRVPTFLPDSLTPVSWVIENPLDAPL